MFKNFFLKNFSIIFLISKVNAFENNAEQLIQSTTEDAKAIILNNNIKIEEKKKKIEQIALKCGRRWIKSFYSWFFKKRFNR